MQTSRVRRVSLGAVGLLAAAVLLLPACQQSGLRVRVSKTASWATGYEATITVANEGRGTIEGWTVEFDLPQGAEVQTYWNAGVSQYGSHIKAKSLNYNAKVKRNRSVEFGFTVSGTGMPTNCKINGEACGRLVAKKTAKSKPTRKRWATRPNPTTTTTTPSSSTTVTTEPSTTDSTTTSTVPTTSTTAPSAAELLAGLDSCKRISKGEYATDSDATGSVPVCGTAGGVYWEADMDIDCDGVATLLCNETTDPWFQPDTFLHTSQALPLDSSTLPYVVLPSPSATFDYRDHGIAPGDVVAVIHDGQVEYAIFGDTGPTDIIGEGSYALAERLGIDPDPLRGGTDDDVTYIAFPGSKVSPVEDHAAAVARGQEAARQLLTGD
jgi:hypothetical protein